MDLSIDQLKVTVQKNRMGDDYIQLMSSDQVSVNIVINAKQIIVEDVR